VLWPGCPLRAAQERLRGVADEGEHEGVGEDVRVGAGEGGDGGGVRCLSYHPLHPLHPLHYHPHLRGLAVPPRFAI